LHRVSHLPFASFLFVIPQESAVVVAFAFAFALAFLGLAWGFSPTNSRTILKGL
jgi:hypothetical protein